MIGRMDIPSGWKVVINYSKGHYNTENYVPNLIGNTHNSKDIINLQRGFLNEEDLSLLLYASDAVILPYKVTMGSGVMFDALAHGIPFVASDLGFFKEFAEQGLGITVKRMARAFSSGIKRLDSNYDYYIENIEKFKKNLRWDVVASEHESIYSSIVEPKN
jgi:glycosyltransferase involved in cell wall biosynthesis